MADRYNAGQIWRTQERPQDGDVHIPADIGDKAVGKIFSIALTGTCIHGYGIEGGIQTVLPHVPATKEVPTADATESATSVGATADHTDFQAFFTVPQAP